jgi:hypothetical protein
VQLFDGHVITLAVLYAGVGEIAEQQQNDEGSSAELEVGLGLTRHKNALARAVPWSYKKPISKNDFQKRLPNAITEPDFQLYALPNRESRMGRALKQQRFRRPIQDFAAIVDYP